MCCTAMIYKNMVVCPTDEKDSCQRKDQNLENMHVFC